jgi:RNase P/RNase MRP subunit POP5
MAERVLRLRRRYIGVTTYPDGMALDDAWLRVMEVFKDLYGLMGVVSSGLKRVRSGGRLIIVCYHTWVPEVVAAITLVNEIGGRQASLDIYKISGTIRGVAGED